MNFKQKTLDKAKQNEFLYYSLQEEVKLLTLSKLGKRLELNKLSKYMLVLF